MPPSLPRLCAAALLTAAFMPVQSRAQDTTRARVDSVRADTGRARQDTVHVRVDTVFVQVRIPVPPPVQLPWRFQIDVGFQAVGGNSDLTVLNSAVAVERRTQDQYILNTKVEARYGKSNGVESVNYQALSLRYDYHPRAQLSPFLGLDFQHDPIRKIRLRAQGGVGFNLNLDIRDDRRTYLSAGLVFDHQEYLQGVSPGSVDDKRWLLRAATVRLLGPATRIEATAKYQPTIDDFGDYLAAVSASVRVSLTRRMGISTKVEFKRDSRPATGVVPDDRSLSVGLSFAW